MRYNQKNTLYESIMRDVAKVVKRRLNESNPDLISREGAEEIFREESGRKPIGDLISREDAEKIIRTDKRMKYKLPKDIPSREWSAYRLKQRGCDYSEDKLMKSKGDKLVNRAIRFLTDHEYDMLYMKYAPKKYIITDVIDTVAYEYFENTMFLNYNYIKTLDESELAYVILHMCAYNKFISDGAISYDEFGTELTRKYDKEQCHSILTRNDMEINRYIETKYPYFRGYASKLNSPI